MQGTSQKRASTHNSHNANRNFHKSSKKLSNGQQYHTRSHNTNHNKPQNQAIDEFNIETNEEQEFGEEERKQQKSIQRSKQLQVVIDDEDTDCEVEEINLNEQSGQNRLKRANHDQMAEIIHSLIIKNKITSKNAFEVPFPNVQEMSVFKKVEETQAWKRLATTLETGAKIYGFRVDNVADDTYKILGGLHRQDMHELENAIQDEAYQENPSSNHFNKKHGKRKDHQGENTLEKNHAAVSVVKYDLEFDVDPLFQKTTAKFDESGAHGLLLNNLNCDCNMSLIFDSSSMMMYQGGKGGANQLQFNRSENKYACQKDVMFQGESLKKAEMLDGLVCFELQLFKEVTQKDIMDKFNLNSSLLFKNNEIIDLCNDDEERQGDQELMKEIDMTLYKQGIGYIVLDDSDEEQEKENFQQHDNNNNNNNMDMPNINDDNAMHNNNNDEYKIRKITKVDAEELEGHLFQSDEEGPPQSHKAQQQQQTSEADDNNLKTKQEYQNNPQELLLQQQQQIPLNIAQQQQKAFPAKEEHTVIDIEQQNDDNNNDDIQFLTKDEHEFAVQQNNQQQSKPSSNDLLNRRNGGNAIYPGSSLENQLNLENFQETIGRIGTGGMTNLNNKHQLQQNGAMVNEQEEEEKKQEAYRKKLLTNQNKRRQQNQFLFEFQLDIVEDRNDIFGREKQKAPSMPPAADRHINHKFLIPIDHRINIKRHYILYLRSLNVQVAEPYQKPVITIQDDDNAAINIDGCQIVPQEQEGMADTNFDEDVIGDNAYLNTLKDAPKVILKNLSISELIGRVWEAIQVGITSKPARDQTRFIAFEEMMVRENFHLGQERISLVEDEDKYLHFTNILDKLPSIIGVNCQKVSKQACFISVLHLANEKKLKLQVNDTFSNDFIICLDYEAKQK